MGELAMSNGFQEPTDEDKEKCLRETADESGNWGCSCCFGCSIPKWLIALIVVLSLGFICSIIGCAMCCCCPNYCCSACCRPATGGMTGTTMAGERGEGQ